jgi:hypothetical protein
MPVAGSLETIFSSSEPSGPVHVRVAPTPRVIRPSAGVSDGSFSHGVHSGKRSRSSMTAWTRAGGARIEIVRERAKCVGRNKPTTISTKNTRPTAISATFMSGGASQRTGSCTSSRNGRKSTS